MFRGWVILFAAVICCSVFAHAQSLRGKVVYVSASRPVKLQFGSKITNYSFVERDQAGLFNVHYAGKRNLAISSTNTNFRPANLVVNEGSNIHLFVLQYKEGQEVYDFSSTEKLFAEINKLKMVMDDPSAREAFGWQPINVPASSTVKLSTESTNASKEPEKTVPTPVLPVSKDKTTPAPPVSKSNTASASPVSKNSTTPAPPVSKDNTIPPPPVSKNSTASAPAVSKDNTIPSPPVSKNSTASASPISKDNTIPLPPVSKSNTTSASPVSKNSTTPASPVSKDNTTPASPVSKDNTASAPPVSKNNTTPVPIPEPMETNPYEQLIHLGDSTAWIAKDFKSSLQWYDSAQKINPQSTYPRKQKAAVTRMLNEQLMSAKQERSKKFQSALPYYKSADTFRVARKFAEAYAGYSKFLSQLDSSNDYMSSEQYYINQAKDYLARLQPYLPKPAPEAAPAPIQEKGKKKKRKAAGH